jgi:putative heme-binding domain-containing protein
MDDPVQLAFTEEGEPFAVVDIFKSRPTRVDALIYCIDGGVFPYYEAVLGEFKRTGPLLPAVSELGWVAPSGLIRYRSDHLGKDFTDTMLSTQFNTHKVVRHTLSRVGAGFTSKDEDFITSTNPDFHPTSLVEDADGSLLVIDTGGWFRIGCPTSQVAKPEIKGGIYRVRRKDAPKVDDPRGEKIDWEKLAGDESAQLLGDRRSAVRDRIVGLIGKKPDAVRTLREPLEHGRSSQERLSALWALARVESDSARSIVRSGLKSRDARVRQAAARATGLDRDELAALDLNLMLRDPISAARREAAIALGRLRLPKMLETHALLDALRGDEDRFLEHAIIHAVIEIDNAEVARFVLTTKAPASQRAALIALDQMADGKLNRDDVVPLLLNADRALQQTAWQIALKHREWFSDMTGMIRRELRNPEMTEAQREFLREPLTVASQSLEIELFISEALADDETSTAGRLLLLDVVAAADGSKPPPSLVATLKSQLTKSEMPIVLAAIRAIRARGLESLDGDLQALLSKDSTPAGVKLALLSVVAPRMKQLPPAQFDFVLGHWADDPRSAAQILGTATLSDDQLRQVAGRFPRATPLELPRLLDAFRQSSSERVGLMLVNALNGAPAFQAISPSDLRVVLAKYPASVQTAAEPLFKNLAIDESAQRQKLAELAGLSEKGDKERGRQLFFGRKALCAACHAVKGEGERIGPDLTKIGSLRTETDLLESVLFPSSSIARGYESVTVHTKDGQSQSGLIRRETADAIYLVTTDRTERRYARANIESLEPSRTSIMPQGLEAQMTRQELGDLIAFLRALK